MSLVWDVVRAVFGPPLVLPVALVMLAWAELGRAVSW